MLNSKIADKDIKEAKQHLFIALDEMKDNLPKNHDELIERMRDYFDTQRVPVFSRIVVAKGEGGFRDFIAETVVESGFYKRDDQGAVVVAQ